MSQILISYHFYALQPYFHVIFHTKGYYPICHIPWFANKHNDLVKRTVRNKNSEGNWITKALIIIIVTMQLLQDLSKHISYQEIN